MDYKEILVTEIAVTVGILLANIISKKVPMLAQFDSYHDSNTFDGSDMFYGDEA